MSVAMVVLLSLLGAFALAVGVLGFSYPLGRLHNLWCSVTDEERARFGVSSAPWEFLGRLLTGAWLLRFAAVHLSNLLPDWRAGLSVAAFLRSPFVFGLILLAYATLLFSPILWSGRVLRQPAGGCSVALRRLALWTFPLSLAALGSCVLFVLWIMHLPSVAVT